MSWLSGLGTIGRCQPLSGPLLAPVIGASKHIPHNVCSRHQPTALNGSHLHQAGRLMSYQTPHVNITTSTPNYFIAVPSYDRAHTLKNRTLSALAASGIDCSRNVHVFCATEQEAETYKETLPVNSYASIMVGKLGIGAQRDHILKHFYENVGPDTPVVMLDDDIQSFEHKYNGPVDLHSVIIKGFELSKHYGCYMWGLNNCSNKFYMRPTYSVGWCFFQGPFMAFRTRKGVQLHDEFNDLREDVQYSLMHCDVDEKVLRLNGVGLKARPYGKEPGGLQTHMTRDKRNERDQVNKEFLMGRYAKFIRSWEDHRPHPALKKSPEHKVHPLEF